MDFRQLKYFLVVSEELSFSRAAERCFISQSAISHQVARLEKELGATLFERSTRAVRLAPAGSRLVPIAQQVLSLETMAYSVARDPRARIRITGNMSFAAQTLDASHTCANFIRTWTSSSSSRVLPTAWTPWPPATPTSR